MTKLDWKTPQDLDSLPFTNTDDVDLAESETCLVVFKDPKGGYVSSLATKARWVCDPIEDQYDYWADPESGNEVQYNSYELVMFAKVPEYTIFDTRFTEEVTVNGLTLSLPKQYEIPVTLYNAFLEQIKPYRRFTLLAQRDGTGRNNSNVCPNTPNTFFFTDTEIAWRMYLAGFNA